MRILITGAGGFIGSHLVDSQLEQGHQVRAVDLRLDLLNHQADHPCLEAIRGDITEQDLVARLVEGIDLVYHLASAHLDVSLSNEHYRRVNVDATLMLSKMAGEAGVKRFLHCSSVGVIGDVKHPPADETTECHPENIYEQTKLEGERTVLDLADRTGLPVIVVRPAWVYGPRCPRTAKLIRTISQGRFPIFGGGRNMRHPVFISDAIHALELCAETQNIEGEVFIIAGNVPIETRELIDLISRQLNVRSPRIYLPSYLGMMTGLALEVLFKALKRQAPFSRRSMDFYLKNNAYTISKALSRLNFQPQVDLLTGIRKTIQSIELSKASKNG